MPEIMIKGRFWAEEGTIFFRNAWELPPSEALLVSYGGYLNIVANTATLAARWLLPLSYAPYFTILVGLLFQLCPPFLLLSASDSWLQPLHVRLTGLLLLLFVPASEEIWLQTLHCQLELTLCCGMIVALQTVTGPRALFRLAVLMLAPLCGPGAIALVPLFWLRAMLDRSRDRRLEAMILTIGAVIQLSFFFHIVSERHREYAFSPIMLLQVITARHLILPFMGMWIAEAAARCAAVSMAKFTVILPLGVIGSLAAVTLSRRREHPAFWFLAAGLLVAAASYFGAIGRLAQMIHPSFGERYTYVPQALFSLTALTLAANSVRRMAFYSWTAVVWLLVIGANEFCRPWWPEASDGPPWRHEVSAWRADPSHILRIWPVGWTMTLAPTPDAGAARRLASSP